MWPTQKLLLPLQTELNLQYQLHIMINTFEKRLQ